MSDSAESERLALREAALGAFEPMVIHFSSSTPDYVSLETVVDRVARDPAMKDRFFVIDVRGATAAAASTVGAATTAAAGGGAAGKAAKAVAEKAAQAAGLPLRAAREAYEQVAISRELARREAAAARARRLARVKEQYVEDGLSEEEALTAAMEDLREEEAAEADGEDGGADGAGAEDGSPAGDVGGTRVFYPLDEDLTTPSEVAQRQDPLLVCLIGLPGTAEDVKDLATVGVPLHAVFDVTSRVALSGSMVWEQQEVDDKPRSRGGRPSTTVAASAAGPGPAGGHKRGAHGKGGAAADGDALARTLPERLADHQARGCGGSGTCCAVGDVLLHTFEFPCESVQGAVDGSPLRLAVPEKVALAGLVGCVVEAAGRLRLYRRLMAGRRVVRVPAYTPLPDPLAAVSAAAGSGMDEHAGSRPSSDGGGGKRRSVSPPRKLSPAPAGAGASPADAESGGGAGGGAGALTTPARPVHMAEVAARTVEYHSSMDAGGGGARAGPAARFAAACVRQAVATTTLRQVPTRLSLMPAESTPFSPAPLTGPPRLLPTPAEASALAMAADKARAARLVESLLTACIGRGGGAGRQAANAQHTKGGAAGAPVCERAACQVGAVAGPTTGEVGLVAVVESLLSSAFPHLPAGVATAQAYEVLRWATMARPGAAASDAEAVLRSVLAQKNLLGWVRAVPVSAANAESMPTTITAAGEVAVFSRQDGTARCQQSTFALDSPTTFPLFVQYLERCAEERSYYYPPPPPSDADSDGEKAEETSEDETETDDDDDEEEDEGNDDGDEDGEAEEGSGGREGGTRRRTRKKSVPPPPPPPPLVDHFRIVQRLQHRRRVYDEVRRRYAQPLPSELVAVGPGAHAASEDVHWCFPSDACTVEVEQSCANSRHVRCTVTAPTAVVDEAWAVGFITEDPLAPGGSAPSENAANAALPPASVPASVRGFLRAGPTLRLLTEVAADNSLAAEREAYERAVTEARAQARAAFEALAGAGKTKGGRGAAATAGSHDKGTGGVVPTLAEMEEAAVAAVPVVQERVKERPHMRVSMLLGPTAAGPVSATLRRVDGALVLHYAAAPMVDLRVTVWRSRAGTDTEGGYEEVIRVERLSRVLAHVDGVLELHSPDAEGYRVYLGPHGSCVAVHIETGAAVLRDAAGGRTRLLPTPPSPPPSREVSETVPAPVSVTPSAAPTTAMAGRGEAVRMNGQSLAPLRCAAARAGGEVGCSVRGADGFEFSYASAGPPSPLLRVCFGSGLAVSWSAAGEGVEAVCTWTIGPTHVQCSTTRQWVTLLTAHDGGEEAVEDALGVAVTYRHPEQSLVVRSARPEGRLETAAVVDLNRYRLEMHLRDTEAPARVPRCSWYTADVAFGGLYGETTEADEAGGVVRVSPLGRLSLERGDGQQVLPPGYDAGGRPELLNQPLLRTREVLSSAFVSVISGSGVEMDETFAVHLCERPTPCATGVFTRVPVEVPPAQTMDALAVCERARAAAALRALLPVVHAAGDENPRALLLCRVRPSVPGGDGRGAYFLDRCIASCLVDRWVRALPRTLREAVPPQLLTRRGDGAVDVYAATADALVLTACRGPPPAAADAVAGWWQAWVEGARIPLVAEVPSAQVTAVATDARRGRQVVRSLPQPTLTEARPGTATAAKAGRLCYWTSPVSRPISAVRERETTTGRDYTPMVNLTEEDRATAALTESPEPAEAAAEVAVERAVAPVEAAASSHCPSHSGAPLMSSKTPASTVNISATYGPHPPSLVVAGLPLEAVEEDGRVLPVLDFGVVVAGRRYAARLGVTNTSTVPCRYRISVPQALRGVVSVAYPHRFLAAGMTDTVTVTLSGWQPTGEVAETLSIVYGGATREVVLRWRTAAVATDCATTVTRRAPVSSATVVCLGEAEAPFQPGITRRVRTRDSDDDAGVRSTEESASDSSSDVGDVGGTNHSGKAARQTTAVGHRS